MMTCEGRCTDWLLASRRSDLPRSEGHRVSRMRHPSLKADLPASLNGTWKVQLLEEEKAGLTEVCVLEQGGSVGKGQIENLVGWKQAGSFQSHSLP